MTIGSVQLLKVFLRYGDAFIFGINLFGKSSYLADLSLSKLVRMNNDAIVIRS